MSDPRRSVRSPRRKTANAFPDVLGYCIEALEKRVFLSTAISIADSSAIEPAPDGIVNMNFTVTRTGDLTSQVTVGYTTVPGTAQPNTDFKPQTGTTTFTAGSATATIVVPIFNDDFYSDPSLTFSVKLTGAVSPTVTLAPLETFATGSIPFSMTPADVNGDGKPDLIISNFGDDTVSVLLNTTMTGATSPSFAPQQTFATGGHPYTVTTADVNGDGKPDLIISNSDTSTVSVLLNTTLTAASSASFATQQTFATGSHPYTVTSADINGDGKPDIIASNLGSNTVSVLLNTTATGATAPSFATQRTFAVGKRPLSMTTADLNGDGKPDLVVVNAYSATLSVLLNTTAAAAAAPSFAAQQTIRWPSFVTSVLATDVNGDGKPDLIVASILGDGQHVVGGNVGVLLNTTTPGAPTATFAAPQTFATGNRPGSVVAADINGDGKPDLLVANIDSYTVSVLVNTATPGATTSSFAAQQTFAAGIYPLGLVAADINGDGKPDVAVANEDDDTISVLLNNPPTIINGNATGTIIDLPRPNLQSTPVPAGVVIGSTIANQATITGGHSPTGTVTFKLYNNPTGSGTPLFSDTETLVNGIATSTTYIPTVVGTDYWVATYSGDNNNSPVAGSAAGAPVVVSQASPMISTTPIPPGVIVGGSIADTVTLSGGYIATGTVTFALYNNASGAGTPLFSDTETLSGGVATSNAYITTAVGTDYWIATYNGDSNNSSAASSAAGGSVTIAKAVTGINVISSANPAVYGQPITFKATVSNMSGSGGVPSGNVQFIIDGANYGSPVTLNATGHAISPSINFLGGASHSVLAVYLPSSSFLGSSVSLTQLIQSVAVEPDPSSPALTGLFIGSNGAMSNDHVLIQPIGGSNTGVNVQTQLNGVNAQTNYGQSFSTIYIFLQNGNENVQLANNLTINFVITTGNGTDNIQLGNGNDLISLGNGNDNIQAGAGINTIVAGNGNDNVHLGNGSENSVSLGNGNDNVQIGSGNNEFVVVGNGNDNVQLGDGSFDTVTIGTGNDTVRIGNGNNNTVFLSLLGNPNAHIKFGNGTGNTIRNGGEGVG